MKGCSIIEPCPDRQDNKDIAPGVYPSGEPVWLWLVDARPRPLTSRRCPHCGGALGPAPAGGEEVGDEREGRDPAPYTP